MRKTITNILFAIPLIFAVTAANSQTSHTNTAIKLSDMDKSVRPNDDFFRFVNGTWFDRTEIPADKTSWGSFAELRLNTDRDVLAILKTAATNPAYLPTTDQGKAINLYKSVLDTVARNQKGTAPLMPYLKSIDAIKNVNDLQRLMVEMQPFGSPGFFSIWIGGDKKDSNRHAVYVGPGSLGLPDQDYYLSEDANSIEKRTKYVQHIANMLAFLGETPAEAKANADRILAIETAMSRVRLNRVALRDGRITYNPMSVAELQKLTPAIAWSDFLTNIGLDNVNTIVVSQPKYMTALQQLFSENDLASWKAYLKWNLLHKKSSQLSTAIERADWQFYSKTLQGAVTQLPIEKRALDVVDGSLGEALGRLYVEQKFPPEAKIKAELMIQNIITAFETRINNLSWMTHKTKISAVEKLKKTRVKVGYPDAAHWKDYSKLAITPTANGGSYFDNMLSIASWRYNRSLERFDEPVNKNEWFTSPQTVNAFYSASANEIVFPAAILQPPFYDYKADEAVNYGAIGAAIGHEISHGFDDSGARYNADGNLVDWWSDEDLQEFTKLGNKLADQFSAIEPLPGTFVDGKFTLGENIGDLGGVNAAFDGLQLYLKQNGNPGLIDGFTPEQRFFISWATIWRTKSRDEAIKNQVKTDPHTPGNYRAYVPLQNIGAFYDAFNIKEGDGMYIAPEKRIKIW